MNKLIFGVIGAGKIGKLHIENILQYLPCVQIKSVADPYVDEAWIKDKAISKLVRDADKVIDDEEIDAILICSPTPLHAMQIIRAARAGKHIFCEKPIAMTTEEITLAIEAVKQAGVKLQIGFNRRFDPNFAKMKRMLCNQDIGSPYTLRITSRDPEIPTAEYLQTSSGMFLDMTIHDFDMARFLMGSEIDEVYATGSVLVDPIFKQFDDVDTAIVNLKFTNGSLGVIDNSRQAVYGYDQRVEVFGSKGKIHAENNLPTNISWSTKDGINSEKPLHFFLGRYKDAYIAEMQAFFACIVNDVSPAVTGMDGLISVIVSMAAKKSLIENRPVKVNYEHWKHLT